MDFNKTLDLHVGFDTTVFDHGVSYKYSVAAAVVVHFKVQYNLGVVQFKM